MFVDEVGALSAVANGHLVTSWPALLRHTSTGEVHQRLDAGLRDSNLLTADQLVTQPTGLCRGSMVWLDRSTGGWSSWSAGCTTEPLVTSRGTVLVGKQTDVYELNRDGSVRWSCPLSPRASRVNGAAVLTGNRWVVGDSVGNIDAYDLPVSGLGRGWVTPHGSPARASRPMR